jgi:hypothetical protein
LPLFLRFDKKKVTPRVRPSSLQGETNGDGLDRILFATQMINGPDNCCRARNCCREARFAVAKQNNCCRLPNDAVVDILNAFQLSRRTTWYSAISSRSIKPVRRSSITSSVRVDHVPYQCVSCVPRSSHAYRECFHECLTQMPHSARRSIVPYISATCPTQLVNRRPPDTRCTLRPTLQKSSGRMS